MLSDWVEKLSQFGERSAHRSDTSVKDKAKYYNPTEPEYMQGPNPTGSLS
jgi:hypothetical protein